MKKDKNEYKTIIESRYAIITKTLNQAGETVKVDMVYKSREPKTPEYKGFNTGTYKDSKNNRNYKQVGLWKQ